LRESSLRAARSEQLKAELDSATFHPITNMSGFHRTQKTEDMLISYGKKKIEKLE